MTPSICGSFLVDKRSLVAFTWTITTVMTLVAFIGAVVMMIQVHSHYKYMERYYEQQLYNYNQNNNYQYNQQQQQNGEGEEDQQQQQASHDSADNEYNREIQAHLQLSQITSNSMTFVAVYTMSLAVALCLYGSTAIVGFTSLRGDYIAPCFSSEKGSARLRLGIFGGAVVFFANVLLVAAVVLGEVRIEDFRNNNREGEDEGAEDMEMEQYEVERIATILAVTCMFLSALYIIFAVLLFLYFGNGGDEDPANAFINGEDEAVAAKGGVKMSLHHTPVVGSVVGSELGGGSSDPRRESFIVGRT